MFAREPLSSLPPLSTQSGGLGGTTARAFAVRDRSAPLYVAVDKSASVLTRGPN